MTTIKEKLKNHKGQFKTISVYRVKSGAETYCAKVQRVTDKTLRFLDVNSKQNMIIPLKNILKVS